MKIILLTKGMEAFCDEQDFDWLNQWKWSYTDQGYAVRLLKSRRHLGMQTAIGERMGLIGLIDHRDQDKLNNQRYNLRLATKSQNGANRGIPANNTSGYKGVVWHKQRNKWVAQIKKDGVRYYLGLFESAYEAALAYNERAYRYWGEFAALNEV